MQEQDIKLKRGVKRGLIAGVWGTVLMAVGWRILYDNLALILIGLPALGIPWLVYQLNDQGDEGVKVDAGIGLMTLFVGGFYTLMCALPVAPLVLILRAVFGR